MMKCYIQNNNHRPDFSRIPIMKSSAIILFFCFLLAHPTLVRAQIPWRQVTLPSVREAAASFAKPPGEFGAIHWAIWGGQQTKERIVADIEHIYANGGRVYMINNSR